MQHILIVDDDETVRRLLQIRLEMQGHLCLEAEDGSRALDALQIHHFDLVITDYEMPVMKGLELLAHIREMPETLRPPVIFISGCLTDDLRHAALEAGACTVIPKPYETHEIMIEITRILDYPRKHQFKTPPQSQTSITHQAS